MIEGLKKLFKDNFDSDDEKLLKKELKKSLQEQKEQNLLKQLSEESQHDNTKEKSCNEIKHTKSEQRSKAKNSEIKVGKAKQDPISNGLIDEARFGPNYFNVYTTNEANLEKYSFQNALKVQ